MFDFDETGFAQRDAGFRPDSIFGDVAELYQRFRVGYPAEIAEMVLRRAAKNPVVLEIGAGTGKATELFLDSACSVDCLEPSPEMAAVLTRRLGQRKLVVRTERFEDAEIEPRKYDLIVAAESWFHVPRKIALVKANSGSRRAARSRCCSTSEFTSTKTCTRIWLPFTTDWTGRRDA